MNTILIGMFIIVIFFVMGFSGLRFILTATSTTGEIIRMISRTDDNRIHSSAPVVRYSHNNGVLHVHESSLFSSRSNRLNVGDEIRIYYRPNEPDYAHAGSWLSFFSFEIYGITLGIMILLIGIYDYR